MRVKSTPKRVVGPGLIALCLLAAPSVAAAADCGVPGPADPSFTSTAVDIQGDALPADRGTYVPIPFTVPAGTTAIRVRLSYDQPPGLCGISGNNTIDLGVYEPRDAGETSWGPDELRGWTGSAVPDLAIAVNGFSDEAVYEAAPRAFVHGRTTRGYRPGAIPAGEWAVELGLGYIDPLDVDGVHYRVVVETTDSADWSTGAPWSPLPTDTGVADPDPGWYAGDLHVHGEMEPGNATMSESLDYAFSPTDAGLDFVTLVDHNNDVAHDGLGAWQAQHPGKLVIPGTEVTTYRGHHNNQGTGVRVDFRDKPAVAFAAEKSAGAGWSQINHPTIFKSFPALCRGCAWDYDDAETGMANVDAIEVQTGPAAVSLSPGAELIFNPFTTQAFAFYEDALDSGATPAAVGVSDDHQGGGGSGTTYSPIGSATTMVRAASLSPTAVADAIRGGRTYVKLFGNDGPEVTLDAEVTGTAGASIGGTVAGPAARLHATVSGAASSGRPGTWTLQLLKDGVPVGSVPFSGDSFAHDFADQGTGRYALKVVRVQGVTEMTEVYTSPLWFNSTAAPPPSGDPPSASTPPTTTPAAPQVCTVKKAKKKKKKRKGKKRKKRRCR